MWTIEYAEDIESDLSAFHRVDDPMTLAGPRYFMLALRLGTYMGALAARAEQERQERDGGARPASAPAATAPTAQAGTSGVVRVTEDVAFAQLADGWVEHETEGKRTA